MEQAHAKRIIEGLLFVSGQPLPLKRLLDVMPELDSQAARELLASLAEEYRASQRAFQLQEVAGGYQLVTDEALAPRMARLLERPKTPSVSTAALETLAIVAYRQPVTKAEVDTVRGVDVTASLDTLLERAFIRIVGRKESPGRPFLYGTTADFLRHFGLKSLEALPQLDVPGVPEPTEAAAPAAAAPAAGGADGS